MFKYTPLFVPHNILVVGCGGTGSRLVPLLAQFLRSITKEHSSRGWLENPNLVLCDFDTIEPKNLMRQNFVPQDVDKNKAAVLADRYGRAFGMNIVPMIERVEGSTDIYEFFRQKLNVNLINNPLMVVMCVDSVKARRAILNNIGTMITMGANPHSITVIDSGNEDDFGQVNVFNPIVLTEKNYRVAEYKEALPKMITTVAHIEFLPMDICYYLDMQDNPGMGSCADLDQTLAINAIVATNIMGFIQNFYFRKPFNYNSIHIDMSGGSYVSHNSLANFKGKAISGSVRDLLRSYPTGKSGGDEGLLRSRELSKDATYGEHAFYDLSDIIIRLESAQAEEARRKAVKAERERLAAETKAKKLAAEQAEKLAKEISAEQAEGILSRTEQSSEKATGTVIPTEVKKRVRTKKVLDLVDVNPPTRDEPVHISTLDSMINMTGSFGATAPYLWTAPQVNPMTGRSMGLGDLNSYEQTLPR